MCVCSILISTEVLQSVGSASPGPMHSQPETEPVRRVGRCNDHAYFADPASAWSHVGHLQYANLLMNCVDELADSARTSSLVCVRPVCLGRSHLNAMCLGLYEQFHLRSESRVSFGERVSPTLAPWPGWMTGECAPSELGCPPQLGFFISNEPALTYPLPWLWSFNSILNTGSCFASDIGSLQAPSLQRSLTPNSENREAQSPCS